MPGQHKESTIAFRPSALVLTVIDIVDGAAYLFGKERPEDRRNWKAELKVEQYRHVLEMDGKRDK